MALLATELVSIAVSWLLLTPNDSVNRHGQKKNHEYYLKTAATYTELLLKNTRRNSRHVNSLTAPLNWLSESTPTRAYTAKYALVTHVPS